VELFRLLSTEGSVVAGTGTGTGDGIGAGTGTGEKCSLSVSDDSFSSSRESSEEVKEESRKKHGKGQGQGQGQGQVKNEGRESARPLESRWSEDDFASLSVSVRTVDAPLKGGSFIMQPETDDLREFGNYREIGSADMEETEEVVGMEEEGEEEGVSGEEVEGGEGEGDGDDEDVEGDSDSGDADGDGEGDAEFDDSDQDGGTIHKYGISRLLSCHLVSDYYSDTFSRAVHTYFLGLYSSTFVSSSRRSHSLFFSLLCSLLLCFTILLGRQACRIFIIERDQRTARRSAQEKLSLNERSWADDSYLL
jgi:hypothetical protein